jgi:hypothetical protein
MDLKGYSAWISVDGAALKEYNVEISDGKSATCWIASEAGKASYSYHTHALLRQVFIGLRQDFAKYTEVHRELEGLESLKDGIWIRKARWDSLRWPHDKPCASWHAPHAYHRPKVGGTDFDHDREAVSFLRS